MHEAWQSQRGKLNHDWLKNDFIKSVDAFTARLGQPEPDEGRIREFLVDDLPQWDRSRPEIRSLLDGAEDSLSPRELFDAYPLSMCTATTMAWLPGLIHALWLNRYAIRQLVDGASQALERADSFYARLAPGSHAALQAEDIDRLKRARSKFREFADALRDLSNAISALPHKILVV